MSGPCSSFSAGPVRRLVGRPVHFQMCLSLLGRKADPCLQIKTVTVFCLCIASSMTEQKGRGDKVD